MPAPRFSVVIPTYNRALQLPAAITSVLAQRDPDFELIVLDDGSTDDTPRVLAAITDPRVRSVTQANAGVSAARNAGAAAATGEYLVFLDSDDELLPDALARFRTAIDADGAALVVSARVRVSADRRQWRTVVPRGLGFLPGAFAIRRSLFEAVGGYDPQLRYGENTELQWRVHRALADGAGHPTLVEEPLVVRYDQPGRAYDRVRYESARRVLEHKGGTLESDVAGTRTPRARRSSYQAIAGVSAAKLGRRREAIGLLARALVNDPRSPARYRNLLGALVPAVRRARSEAEDAATPPAVPAPVVAGAIHGVVVTFGRPEQLAAMVDELARTDLATLTVVDNAPSDASRAAAERAAPTLPTTYVPMPENTGPAGGFAAGAAHVLERAADEDWLLFLDDDRLTNTVDTPRRLAEFGAWLVARGAPVGAVGQVGARFDLRTGRLRRLTDDELAGPVSVDYVAGGQMLMARARAVRTAGSFDPDLFFGFEELDFCLRLARGGYRVYAYGPAGLAARRRFGRLGEVQRVARRESPWRRYYSVRNHIVVMRRATTWPTAVAVTLAHLFGRAFVDVVRRRRDAPALIAASTRGCVHAWSGRLGRRVEPPRPS